MKLSTNSPEGCDLRGDMMFTKRTKLVMGVALFLGILCCLLSCASVGVTMINNYIANSPQEVRRNVVITIDPSQRQKLFDQLRKFADKHAFAILIDTRPSGAENFSVYMHREDIIISGANVFAVGEYKLAFYDADRQHPVSESIYADLVSELKSFVSEVPGATFFVKK